MLQSHKVLLQQGSEDNQIAHSTKLDLVPTPQQHLVSYGQNNQFSNHQHYSKLVGLEEKAAGTSSLHHVYETPSYANLNGVPVNEALPCKYFIPMQQQDVVLCAQKEQSDHLRDWSRLGRLAEAASMNSPGEPREISSVASLNGAHESGAIPSIPDVQKRFACTECTKTYLRAKHLRRHLLTRKFLELIASPTLTTRRPKPSAALLYNL